MLVGLHLFSICTSMSAKRSGVLVIHSTTVAYLAKETITFGPSIAPITCQSFRVVDRSVRMLKTWDWFCRSKHELIKCLCRVYDGNEVRTKKTDSVPKVGSLSTSQTERCHSPKVQQRIAIETVQLIPQHLNVQSLTSLASPLDQLNHYRPFAPRRTNHPQ